MFVEIFTRKLCSPFDFVTEKVRLSWSIIETRGNRIEAIVGSINDDVMPIH